MTPVEGPLVVDLDGTLIRSDLLYESLFRLLSTRPGDAWRLPFWLARGRSTLKARIAERVTLEPATLPLVQEVIDLARSEKARGRRVCLATASTRALADIVAAHLGCFDDVLASDESLNLSGTRKAERLCQEYGDGQFDYVGDSRTDLAVWAHARRAIAVNCSRTTLHALRKRHPDAVCLAPRRTRLWDYVRLVRVHQWVKNALLFLPMLMAHALAPEKIGTLSLAFLAFSSVASSVYLINDLLDLTADRDHATKRRRPLASGAVPLLHAMVMAPVLLLFGGALAATISLPFLGILASYFAVTLAYSLILKRQAVVDVLVLAGLYTLRLIAGGIAARVPLSAWLLAFSMFLFLCLALVKRHTELHARVSAGRGDPRGRGYHLADMPILEALAGAAGYSAVVVLALYVNSPVVTELYRRPEGLWFVCVLLLYWVSRVLLLMHRGEMNDDPVVFALKDRTSLITVLLAGIVSVISVL